MTSGRVADRVVTAGSDAAPPRVRQATARDLDAVVALRVALLREHPDHPIYGRLRPDLDRRARELFAAQLRAPAEAIFLADIDDDTVGILRCVDTMGSPLLLPARYAYVSSVYVKPAARRRGAMRALVLAAEQWCRARGLDQMRLHNVPGSGAAERAWEAIGFGVIEHVRMRQLPGSPG
jgi:GNAT superfamily N-acetyltransferase